MSLIYIAAIKSCLLLQLKIDDGDGGGTRNTTFELITDTQLPENILAPMYS
jgi:hypothetical protein